MKEKPKLVSFKNQVNKTCERKKLPDALQRILIRILSPKMYKYTLMLEKNIAGHLCSKKQGFKNWDLSQPEIDEMVCKKNYRMHCADFMRNCPVEKRLVLERLDCGWEVVQGDQRRRPPLQAKPFGLWEAACRPPVLSFLESFDFFHRTLWKKNPKKKISKFFQKLNFLEWAVHNVHVQVLW